MVPNRAKHHKYARRNYFLFSKYTHDPVALIKLIHDYKIAITIDKNGSVLNSMGLVPSWVLWGSCHRAIAPSCVQNFFSWVFRWSKIFSLGYFAGPKFFSRGYFISWVQNFMIFNKLQ